MLPWFVEPTLIQTENKNFCLTSLHDQRQSYAWQTSANL